MNSFRESIRKYYYICIGFLVLTLVHLSVSQINVPLLLVNSGDDPLVHNSLLTIPRTLAGTAPHTKPSVLCDLKQNLKDTGITFCKETIYDIWKKKTYIWLLNKVTDWNKLNNYLFTYFCCTNSMYSFSVYINFVNTPDKYLNAQELHG